ncbi:hypothetical protein ES703_90059 [subsurface metagenome]
MTRAKDGIDIKKVQKQHSSAIVVIPLAVRFALDIHAGDYLVFASHQGTRVVEMTKLNTEEYAHARSKTDPAQQAGTRRTCAPVGGGE